MSLPLYTDHHVHSGIVRGLRRRGIDVLTAFEDGRADRPDEELLARSEALQRVLFTQDDDFLAIAGRWRQTGHQFSGIVYAHPLCVTIGQAIADLQLILELSEASEIRNQVIFLPL